MREILFRGKVVSDNKWEYGFCLNSKHDRIGYYSDAYHFSICAVIPETVGQFTGLTDMNGKKIFEGDIVKVIYTEKRQYQGVSYDDKHSCVEEVIYSEESACFMLKITLKDISMYRPLHNFENLAMIESIEVIGDIHDNPELLEGVEDGD